MLEDKQIIELFWNRIESAIEETSRKYGRYGQYIAQNILQNKEDVEECVSESYWKLWDTIPPQNPSSLKAYFGKITRNIALHMWEKNRAKKRNSGSIELVFEELRDCIPGDSGMEQITEQMVITDVLNQFLQELNAEQRAIFLARYWYFSSIKDIASKNRISESKVKMILLRLRQKLKERLEKEGVIL